MTNQETITAFANLNLVNLVKTQFNSVEGFSKMPSLFFIKVAITLMDDNEDIETLANVFPIDRDWLDAADFRGHIQGVLNKSLEEVDETFKLVARDPITWTLITTDPTELLDGREKEMFWRTDRATTFFQALYKTYMSTSNISLYM